MNIIYEYKHHNIESLKLFTSDAPPRKNSIRIHHHIMIELSYILKGSGIYLSNGREYTIKEGDVFFYRPNEAHCITDIDGVGMEILNIHIAPNYLYTKFPNALNSDYIKILVSNFDITGNKLNDFLPKNELDDIRNMIMQIKEECIAKRSDFLTVSINILCNILIKIARPFPQKEASKSAKNNYHVIINAIAYIDRHYKEQLTLKELADHAGYSRCYFSDIFKKCLGMSVWDYISIKRIEEALYLIKNTSKTIIEISSECGFNNTANFNKSFKKYTHISPHMFRK